jgi:hypothetical protein
MKKIPSQTISNYIHSKWNFLPLLIWMMIIFFFSNKERVAIGGEPLLNFIFFKSLHVIEYCILYLLARAAFNRSKNNEGLAFVFSLIYAASDELHQNFVATRDGNPRDIFIDLIGISIGLIIFRSLQKKIDISNKNSKQ